MDDTTGHSDVDALGSTNASDFRRPFSPGPRKNFLYVRDCSANDATSFSEWSDGPASSTRPHSAASFRNLSTPVKGERQLPSSSTASVLRDPERVVCQGYLQCLRLKGGVRQWKRLWVVVRPKSLSFYKDEQVGHSVFIHVIFILKIQGKQNWSFPLGILCCQDHPNVPSNRRGGDRSYLSIQGILLSDHRGRKAISTMRSEWGSPNQMARIPQKHYRCSQEIKPGGNNAAVRTVAFLLDIQHSMVWSLLGLAHSSSPSFVPFFDPSYFLPGSISIGPFFF